MIFKPDQPGLFNVGNDSIQVVPDFGFLTETRTLVAAMSSAPDMTRQHLIDKTIGDLKTAGIWALLDECWFMAAHDTQAAKLGWKRYKDLTDGVAPTFTTDRGYQGNGTTMYLNTNYTPSTDSVQASQNNRSWGFYNRTEGQLNAYEMGSRSATCADDLGARWVAGPNDTAVRVNHNSAGVLRANSLAVGLIVARRTASNVSMSMKNGVQIGSNITNASLALNDRPHYILATNNVGTASSFTTRQFAFAFEGASMSSQQQIDLYNIVQAYMTAVGAQV